MGEEYEWSEALKSAHDETVTWPLWEFPPEAAKAVMSERRRRFPGVYEHDEIDPEYS